MEVFPWRTLTSVFVLAAFWSSPGHCQWTVGLEIGADRFWGGPIDTAAADGRSFRPYRPTSFAAALERKAGSLGAALRLTYMEASVALEGSDAVVAVKGAFTVVSAAPEIRLRLVTIGRQNEVWLHGGPLIEIWDPIDVESRTRLGAQGAIALGVPMGVRFSLALTADIAVIPSPFTRDDLDSVYDVRSLWRRGFSVGVNYRL